MIDNLSNLVSKQGVIGGGSNTFFRLVDPQLINMYVCPKYIVNREITFVFVKSVWAWHFRNRLVRRLSKVGVILFERLMQTVNG